jgi:hypothetical protein
MARIVIALVADHTPKNQLRGSYLKNRIIFAIGGRCRERAAAPGDSMSLYMVMENFETTESRKS